MQRVDIRGSARRVGPGAGADRAGAPRPRLLVGCCGWRERRPLPKRAVGPVLVVVQRVGGHDALELSAADDQQPVEAFTTKAPYPAFGVRPPPAVPALAP